MGWKNKVCSNGPGHVAKLATMPIYGKTPLKIFFPEISRPMTFKLGINNYWRLWPYKDCSNNDPGLTLTCFTARSN